MKQYTSIQTLKDDFISGTFQLDEQVQVGDQVYEMCASHSHDMRKIINENEKNVVVYENEESKNWLMFVWGASKNTIIPYDVRTTTQPVTEKEEIQNRVIADKIEVHFLNLPISGSVVAKVDTGAEMCSLHAENVQVNRGQGSVSFVCPELSRSTLHLPLADQQAVKTSGGDTTYRPVVKVSLKVHGKVLKDMLVNLNDRSDMEDPMLLGQNALQAGNFLIDPNIIKEAKNLITEEFLNQLKHQNVTPVNTISDETAESLYEALTEVGNISIDDILKLLRTQVLKRLDEVSY